MRWHPRLKLGGSRRLCKRWKQGRHHTLRVERANHPQPLCSPNKQVVLRHMRNTRDLHNDRSCLNMQSSNAHLHSGSAQRPPPPRPPVLDGCCAMQKERSFDIVPQASAKKRQKTQADPAAGPTDSETATEGDAEGALGDAEVAPPSPRPCDTNVQGLG